MFSKNFVHLLKVSVVVVFGKRLKLYAERIFCDGTNSSIKVSSNDDSAESSLTYLRLFAAADLGGTWFDWNDVLGVGSETFLSKNMNELW